MSILKAKLINWNKIEVTSSSFSIPPHFDLYLDNQLVLFNLEFSNLNRYIYNFTVNGEIPGHEFYIVENGKKKHIDIKNIIYFEGFDFYYTYNDNDLGATYNKQYTKFVLWAPLCSSVILRIKGNEYPLKRTENGIFRTIVDGDLDGELYDYKITLCGEEKIVCDPYAKSTNTNSKNPQSSI